MDFMSQEETIKDFAQGGSLSTALPGFEPRAAQAAMAEAVAEVFDQGGSLLVEAGTGVGKSLAYLMPGLRRVFEAGQSLLISTATLNLQDQILKKDIPAALKALGKDPTALADELLRAMGRSNYFCRLRFELLEGPEGGELFDEASMGGPTGLAKLKAWAVREPETTRDRIPFPVDARLWEK